MRYHKGEHARMGALDVMPFIPIKGINQKECITILTCLTLGTASR